ncbi:MAG: glycosyltransferase [candidate division Zixibacteria bacterium]
MEASIIVTYRCNAKCSMCNIWKNPTKPGEEIKPQILEKLPPLDFCNITGGEPFLRLDILDIIEVAKRKAKRVVISTNGYLTDKILRVAEKHKDVGIRVSIEGLPVVNDDIRGLRNGFDHGLRTLLELRKTGVKDIGFGVTVSDKNARDMIELYNLSKSMNLEFATAALHNSYYFHKDDSKIVNTKEVSRYFDELIEDQLGSGNIKDWFRAYFNFGLTRYIHGKKRLLPCEAGTVNFFVDPWGEVRPCNGMEEKFWLDSMGNINEKSFDEIWNGRKAIEIRQRVKNCPKNCWMIGTASPAMKKKPWKAAAWILKNKLRGYRREMRIAVLGTRGIPDLQGGIEKHCQELYTRLAKRGYEIRVYARKGYVHTRKTNHEDVENYPLYAPRIKSLEAIFHTTWGIIHAFFNKKRFDIIHIHGIGPSLLVPLARLLGFHVVMTHHGQDYNRQKWGRLAKIALRIGEWLGTKYSNEIISVSKAIKDNLEDRFCRDINYIPNGVEIPTLIPPGDYLDNLNIIQHRYILAVGRLVPEKGFHDLLSAFKDLDTDWKLVIAGAADHEDNYSVNLKRLSTDDHRVVMTGKIKGEKLSELYSNAGLFVLPSYHEGLPIVFLEALSYGLDVLYSSIPANAELSQDITLQFPAGNTKMLKEKLKDYLSLPDRSPLPETSRFDKLKEFDWDVISLRAHNLYNSLAQRETDDDSHSDDTTDKIDLNGKASLKLLKKEKQLEPIG